MKCALKTVGLVGLLLVGCDKIDNRKKSAAPPTSDAVVETPTTPPEQGITIEDEVTRPDTSEESQQYQEEIDTLKREIAVERKRAEGESIGVLTLDSGKRYEQVTIRKVTDVGISIFHRDGSARIRAEDLPAALKERFSFDSERARRLLEQEQKLASLHEHTLLAAATAQQSPAASPAPRRAHHAPPVATPSEPPAVPKGRLDARVVSSKRGTKEVEFVSLTNCRATLTVYRVYPRGYSKTYRIPENTRTVHRVRVFNNYRATLTSHDNRPLDEASHLKKTGLGRPRLDG